MRSVGCATLVLIAAVTWSAAAGSDPTGQPAAAPWVGVLDEHPAIQYADRPTRDRVGTLNRRLIAGDLALTFREADGYLRAVLDALRIDAASQLLVFSRTGVQRAATGPLTPRAIYFDAAVVVGYVPGARALELAAHDPEQGVVFYTLDQRADAAPRFVRQTSCLTCHVSAGTLEVPGMIVRSHFMRADADVLPQLGQFTVTHRTPLAERWGGWYVTGDYAVTAYNNGFGHMGNSTVSAYSSSGPTTTSNEAFIRWLHSAPTSRGYLSAESDIAALMLFDHQMHAINLLTRLNWETRAAGAERLEDFARGTLRALVNELADYLLFVDEVPPPGRVTPRRGFAERFAGGGRRDRRGRSLRELELDERLLRYPCSYMIETEAFAELPAAAKEAVYRRLWSILAGDDRHPRYAHLSLEDRRAIVEILRDTQTDLPEVFAVPGGDRGRY